MKKTVVFLVFILFSVMGKGFEVKIVHSPEVKSRFNGVVIIPGEKTPFEFAGYMEEKIKTETRLELINREVFADFLKREKIGGNKIEGKDLIKIYKGFGNIIILFLNLKTLSVNKYDTKKAPCKKGIISFDISLYHSRDGIVIKKKSIEFEIVLCSQTPLYPPTESVVERLFENSSKEVLKTIWPWIETVTLPDIDKKVCKNKEIFDYILENNLEKAGKILEKNKECYLSKPYQYFILKGYTEFFKGNFDTAISLLKKAYNNKKDKNLFLFIQKIKNLEKDTIVTMSIVKQRKEFTGEKLKQKHYVNQYRNSADILLEKLAELERLYKSGKISKEEYMKEKYKLIEEF